MSAVTLAPGALAFCRSTTCEPDKEACSFDDHGCNLDGVPLYWEGGAVSLHVSSEGSPLRAISTDEFEAASTAATETWQNATCAGGKRPSLAILPITLVENAVIEFLEGDENESVVVFQDDAWLGESNAVAKTMLAFYKGSGELIDTDIALNSHDFDFATSGEPGPADLQAVLTHEVGHVLGIDHSDAPGATMKAETSGSSTTALRSLSQDDIDAICNVYPPSSEATDDGGCTVAGTAPRQSSAALAWFVLFGIAGLRSRATSSRRRALASCQGGVAPPASGAGGR